MPRNNKTASIIGGISGAIAIFAIAHDFGAHLIFIPPLFFAIASLFFILRKLDRIKIKHKYFINNWFFCILSTWLTLGACALAAGCTLFILAVMEFSFGNIFDFGMTSNREVNWQELQDFFLDDGLGYLLAPPFWALIGGLFPCILIGSIYSIFRWRNSKSI
jgi:hypothetical protein